VKGIINILVFAVVAGAAIFSIFGIPVLIAWLFFTYAGAAGRAAKAQKIIQTTMMVGEQPITEALQHRVFALFSRRDVVAITDSRILIIRRGLLGGFKMTDIQWKDLRDVTLEQNVLDGFCGSNLSFAHLNAATAGMTVDGVPSDAASAIYSKAQSEEQAWEEKRRIRAMEEVRAAAGGVVVHAPAQAASVPSAAPAGNRMIAEIQQAKQMLDSGTISDAEFQEMKAKILSAT